MCFQPFTSCICHLWDLLYDGWLYCHNFFWSLTPMLLYEETHYMWSSFYEEYYWFTAISDLLSVFCLFILIILWTVNCVTKRQHLLENFCYTTPRRCNFLSQKSYTAEHYLREYGAVLYHVQLNVTGATNITKCSNF